MPDFAYSGWEQNTTGPGRYVAKRADLQFDVQTGESNFTFFSGVDIFLGAGESLWRNVELKPVPDSMTQFPEYETIFGVEFFNPFHSSSPLALSPQVGRLCIAVMI